MKKSFYETEFYKLVSEHRDDIIAEMRYCYKSAAECDGRVNYDVYIWSDGEIESLPLFGGESSWLQAKAGEARSLYRVVNVSFSSYWSDFTDEPIPDRAEDPDEWERVRDETVAYIMEGYDEEAAEALDKAIEDEKREYDLD